MGGQPPEIHSKNRIELEVKVVVVAMAFEYPAYGQTWVANELRKRGIYISAPGFRCVWQRHDLKIFDKRLNALEARVGEDGRSLPKHRVQCLAEKSGA